MYMGFQFQVLLFNIYLKYLWIYLLQNEKCYSKIYVWIILE